MTKTEFFSRHSALKKRIAKAQKDRRNAWNRGNHAGIQKADDEIYRAGLELRKLEDNNPQLTGLLYSS